MATEYIVLERTNVQVVAPGDRVVYVIRGVETAGSAEAAIRRVADGRGGSWHAVPAHNWTSVDAVEHTPEPRLRLQQAARPQPGQAVLTVTGAGDDEKEDE